MAEYKGTVELIGGLTPKNNGTFPLMDAKDIQVDATGKRLDEKLAELGQDSTVTVTIDSFRGTASHGAAEIYALEQAGISVVAAMDGWHYQYAGASHFADDGRCDEVSFYRTMVAEDGVVFTECINIYADKTVDAVFNEATGGSGSLVASGTITVGAGAWLLTGGETILLSDIRIEELIELNVGTVTLLMPEDQNTLSYAYEAGLRVIGVDAPCNVTLACPASKSSYIRDFTFRYVIFATGGNRANVINLVGVDVAGEDTEAIKAEVTKQLTAAKESGEFKGDKGDKGDTYTLTEDDKFDIAAICGQVEAPSIVSSIDEMTDTSKHYVLNGNIWAYRTTTTEGETVLVPNFTNLIKFDASGNPTNVSINKRYSGSAGAAAGYLATQDGSFAINDLVTKKGVSAAVFYITQKPVGQSKGMAFESDGVTPHSNGTGTVNATDVANGENGEYKIIFTALTDAPMVKFSSQISTTAITADSLKGLIVTLDEPITYTEQKTEGVTVSEWYDTGISYAPTFKTDLVGVLGENNVIYLSDNLPSGTYTLKYPDNDYATVGTITK